MKHRAILSEKPEDNQAAAEARENINSPVVRNSIMLYNRSLENLLMNLAIEKTSTNSTKPNHI